MRECSPTARSCIDWPSKHYYFEIGPSYPQAGFDQILRVDTSAVYPVTDGRRGDDGLDGVGDDESCISHYQGEGASKR